MYEHDPAFQNVTYNKVFTLILNLIPWYMQHNWELQHGYHRPVDNKSIVMMWPAFRDASESAFLMTVVVMLSIFSPAILLMVQAQEAVLANDVSGLMAALLALTTVVRAVKNSFLELQVRGDCTGGKNFCSAMIWGKTVAKFTSGWCQDVPGMSGLQSPMFHALDEFFGRTDYSTFLGKEALHLRDWFAPAHRHFIASLREVSVADFVASATVGNLNLELRGLWLGLINMYAGERGLLGVHRYKVYGFLEQVFQTGRTETNGNSSTSDENGNSVSLPPVPLPMSDLIHNQLELSRIERFSDSLGKAVAKTPGNIGDCPYRGRIIKRACIGSSTSDSGTRLVTIDVQGEGLSFSSGDHLLVSTLNVRLFVSSTSITLYFADTRAGKTYHA